LSDRIGDFVPSNGWRAASTVPRDPSPTARFSRGLSDRNWPTAGTGERQVQSSSVPSGTLASRDLAVTVAQSSGRPDSAAARRRSSASHTSRPWHGRSRRAEERSACRSAAHSRPRCSSLCSTPHPAPCSRPHRRGRCCRWGRAHRCDRRRFCRDRDVQLNEAALLPQIKTPASRSDLPATRHNFYNTRRPHSSHQARTPDVVYFASLPQPSAEAA
jgi:hypothetical protein